MQSLCIQTSMKVVGRNVIYSLSVKCIIKGSQRYKALIFLFVTIFRWICCFSFPHNCISSTYTYIVCTVCINMCTMCIFCTRLYHYESISKEFFSLHKASCSVDSSDAINIEWLAFQREFGIIISVITAWWCCHFTKSWSTVYLFVVRVWIIRVTTFFPSFLTLPYI